MQKTEYLKLNKPDSTDFFSVDHQNQNMELIDAELAKKADKKEIENIKAEFDNVNSDLSRKLDNSAVGADSLLSKITTSWVDTPTDDTYFIRQNTGGKSTFGRVKFSTLWSYIKGKADSIYAKVSHTHTKSEVGLGNVDNTADANKSVKYATSAGSANSASKATGVVDYESTANTIQIGFAGSGISGDKIKYIAGYTEGNGSDINAKIKDVSKDALKLWLGLGSLAYSSATIPTIPSSLPANGGNSATVNGHTVNSDVPANAKFTDTIYTHPTNSGYKHIPSGGSDGQILEWSSDGTAKWSDNISVDSEINNTSTNPVQNKVVKAALDGKMPVYSYNGGTFDADDLTSPAIHLINSGGTNLPASCSGGVLLVDGSSQTTQYFFPLYNGDNRIHTRYKYHNTEWTDWEILGLSTSQSTAITTAGKYALDAVQNNASVSGTLANRIKAVEDTVGKVYSKTETVYGSGAWKMSGSLTVPAGTYIITRKGTNINGTGVSLGCGYNALSFVTTPADASTGIYTDIVTYTDRSNSIYIYYCAALNSTINLEIKAVRIK